MRSIDAGSHVPPWPRSARVRRYICPRGAPRDAGRGGPGGMPSSACSPSLRGTAGCIVEGQPDVTDCAKRVDGMKPAGLPA